MKKLAIIIWSLSLALLCIFFAGCSQKAEGTDTSSRLIGTWAFHFNEEYRELITEVINDPAVYDSIYYEFNEDGTGSTYSVLDPEKVNFTYTYDGKNLTISYPNWDPFTVECKVSGKEMKITEQGQTTTFKKQ